MEGVFIFSYKNIVLLLLGVLIFLETTHSANACNLNCSTAANSSVCSSNGVTFPSRCKFEEDKCNHNSDWVIIYEGPCPDSCLKDCSNERTSKVCSSNVQTFNNRCEFEKQKCLQNTNWEIIFENECTTLAPPTDCKGHKKKINLLPYSEFKKRCLTGALYEKSRNGTLKFSDIEHCYDPRCSSDVNYSIHQCDLKHRNWCWCAKPDGTVIPGTFRNGVRRHDCVRQHQCSYDGVIYKNGADILPKNTCGKCNCMNGTVTCSLKYNTSTLNEEQIKMLKSDLLQFFFHRYQNPESRKDIIHIDEHPQYYSDIVIRDILRHKFNHYDKDNSFTISDQERHLFDIEVFDFFHCIDFRSQVYSLINSDQDSSINLKEWGEFFGVENLSRRKRSASSRLVRQKQRRKFQYVLV